MTEAIRTRTFHARTAQDLPKEALRELAQAVREMKVLAFPTDTVYGLGCTGLIKAALRRIYEIKRRDSMKPLPIL
ncbi:MAG: Sua5/YciO/YrdC/YwlC family protein, partial [Elusimicrobiota bacterium]